MKSTPIHQRDGARRPPRRSVAAVQTVVVLAVRPRLPADQESVGTPVGDPRDERVRHRGGRSHASLRGGPRRGRRRVSVTALSLPQTRASGNHPDRMIERNPAGSGPNGPAQRSAAAYARCGGRRHRTPAGDSSGASCSSSSRSSRSTSCCRGSWRRSTPSPGSGTSTRPGSSSSPCWRARASWRSGSSSGSRSAPRAGSTSPPRTRRGTRSGGRCPVVSRPRAARCSSRCSPRPASTSRPRPTALAAAGLLSTATLFALPVLALPAVPFVAINEQLVEGALLAVFMFFVLLAFGAWMIRSDRAIAGVGRVRQLGCAPLPHRRRRRTSAHAWSSPAT